MFSTCPRCGADSQSPYCCDNCGEVMDDTSSAWWDRDTMELECCDIN